MSFQILWKSTDITADCVSYDRSHNICEGTGILRLSTKLRAYAYEPYDLITIKEDGTTHGKFYISSLDHQIPENTTLITAQDASKKLTDYFVVDITETGDAPSYTRTWIEKYLDEAGVSYTFDVSDYGTLVSNNSSFGRTTAMEIIIELLKQSGWYMHTDYGGTIRIGKTEINMAEPAAFYDDTDILSVKTNKNDSSLRNQVVVWGNGNYETGDYVFAKLSVTTPWDRDALDVRKVGVNVAGVRDNMTAAGIASSILKETKKITFIKQIELTGFRDISVGDTVFISSDYYTGAGLITTLSVTVTSAGIMTTIFLDERCERIIGYYDFGDFVYVGTDGAGVWRKHVRYDHTWYDYSTGLTNLVVPDLAIYNGVFACVDGNGKLWTRYSSESAWIPFTTANRFIDEEGTVYGLTDVTCMGCTVTKDTSHVLAIFNLNDQVNRLEVMGQEIYQVVGDPRCWVLDMTSRSTFTITQMLVEDNPNVYGIDIDDNEEYTYVTALYQFGGPGGGGEWKTWVKPNANCQRPTTYNSISGMISPEIYDCNPVTTGPQGVGDYMWYAEDRNDIVNKIQVAGLASANEQSKHVLSDRYMLYAYWDNSIVGAWTVTYLIDYQSGHIELEDSVDGLLSFVDDEGHTWTRIAPSRACVFVEMDDEGNGLGYAFCGVRYGATYDGNSYYKDAITKYIYNPATPSMSAGALVWSSEPWLVYISTPSHNMRFLCIETTAGFVGVYAPSGSGPDHGGIWTSSGGSFTLTTQTGTRNLGTGLAYGKSNDTVYAIKTSPTLEIKTLDTTTIFSHATADYVQIATNELATVLVTSDGSPVTYTVIGLDGSSANATFSAPFSIGQYGDDGDGSFYVRTTVGGVTGIYKYDKDFISGSLFSTNTSIYSPTVYENILMTDYGSRYLIMEEGNVLGETETLYWPYGCLRPAASGGYESVYDIGYVPRVDCSQPSPVLLWGDGPVHGWMYESDNGDENTFSLIDPGYTTGFLYFGPRTYGQAAYSGGGAFSGGGDGYYRRILYPHANSVWNYDVENEIMWDQGHYTDDPEEGEYHDFGYEVKAVETSNFMDNQFMFVACSGESGPLFFQKTGNLIGEYEDLIWNEYSVGLPSGALGQILTIRLDDRN